MSMVTTTPVITKEVIAELFQDLQSYELSDNSTGNLAAFDAFRYEAFARRLIAAEYGRPDAVEWALEWHADLTAHKAAKQAAIDARASELQEEHNRSRAELLSGKCGNPLYQAFLDTVEHPGQWKNNVAYFEFHSKLTVEYRKSGQGQNFLEFVRNYAEQNLSNRVKSERNLH